MRAGWIVAALCAALAAENSVLAQGVEGAEGPELTPVRRTTVVTADPESSLVFYRDLLGYTVEYDRRVTDNGTLALLAPGATEGRAIALRYGDTLGGSIGLFWTPGLPEQKECVTPAQPGAVSILLLTDNLAAVRARLEAAGVPPAGPVASYDQSRGPTNVYAVFDPNCLRVAIAEIQNETLDESLQK